MKKCLKIYKLNITRKTKKGYKKNLLKDKMVMNVTKISQKMKNKSLLIIEKKYHEKKKDTLL